MSLQSTAQELIVLEPTAAPMSANVPLVPLEVVDMAHDAPPPANMESLEVAEPVQVEIVVSELPGAPDGTPEPQMLEVSEDDSESDKEDQNDAQKSKKPEKWDWAAKGATGFIVNSRQD